MIAIKQAKFKPSNKIHENQIKNITTKPSNAAAHHQNNESHLHHHDVIHQHHHLQKHQHNQTQVINSSKNDNYSCQARLAREQQRDGPVAAGAVAVPVKSADNNQQQQHHHHNHQNNSNRQQQQQSNETRSETIDGATTASAAPNKSATAPPPPPPSQSSHVAAPTRAALPPSTATTTSSLSTAAAPASPSPMAVKLARPQQQPRQQPATSLTTASAKIQQRQQKFLAAAARSATSPQCHLDQNLSVIKQQQQVRTSCAVDSKLCNSQIDTPPQALAVAVATAANIVVAPDDCTWCRPTGGAQPAVLLGCEQCIMQQHAPNANTAGTNNSSCSLASAANQSQQLPAASVKRQTVPLLAKPPPSKMSDAINHHGATMARSKVLSMATAMVSGSNGPNLKISGGANKQQQQQRASIDNDQYRSSTPAANLTTNESCASLDATTGAPAAAIATAAASDESCGIAANAGAVVSRDVGDFVCNQECARPQPPSLRCDASSEVATNLTTKSKITTTTTTSTTTGAYQQQVSPPANIISQQPQRADVRQQSSGDQKQQQQENNDDNISNKNTTTTTTTKHNNHYHYHHYYNQNYLNFHRFQQQQPHQPQPYQQNYFHHQQQQHTTINSSANQTTQHHQPVMAHYKFHNDCQSSVLTYEQVKRLDFVMDQTVPIHGRGNSPTLYVKLKELIRLVKYKLQHEHSIEIRDVRLNGGAASYVLAPENSKYNDLDLVFGTDLSNEDRFDVIRDVVLDCLMEFYPRDNQAQHPHHDQDQSTGAVGVGGGACGGSLRINGSNIEPTGGNNEEGEEDEDDQPASRSNRSSSFESDNLNITTNELESDGCEEGEEDDDDEEDDVIVRIDSDDTGCGDSDGKNEEEEDDDDDDEKLQEDTASDSVGHSGEGSTPTPGVEGKHEADEAVAASSYHSYPGPYHHQYYHQYNQMPPNTTNNINNCAFKEAYVHKMVKVNDDDRWSLISLGVQQSETTQGSGTGGGTGGGGGGGHLQQAATGCNQQAALGPNAATSQQAHTSPAPAANWCDDNFASQQQQQHQNQPPNSIELKFVDKMRRKFEFSVDSFQIILDSLIQFYDYAPQSTITIQRKTSSGDSIFSANPIFNANPLMGLRHCLQCDREQGGGKMAVATAISENPAELIESKNQTISKCETGASRSVGKKYTCQAAAAAAAAAHRETTSLSDARSFYELPLEPGNSLSNSSVASSSGCSSSSSVVSSSSSSLSCDEDQDQEDLYCEVDNSPSSSASTSSLLSSTTTSGTGSPCDPLLGSAEPSKSSSQQNQHNNVILSGNSGQHQTNNQQARPAATVTYHVPDSISDGGGSSNSRQQQHQQSHVNIRPMFASENLCNNFAAKTTFSSTSDNTHRISSCAVISENFYPTVIGRSEYGNFKEALYHLEKKLIATRSPEEIRGGGLLKYCNLLVKNYKPTNVYQIRTLERYMCSRFFIDFSDLNQQRAKLESYLANHFSDDAKQKFDYLTILHNVVQRSTVCLMNHEMRLTLNMIREFAYNLDLPQHHQQQQQQNQNQAESNGGNQHQQLPCAAVQQQQQQHQRSPAEKQGHFYQQQKPTTMQSGVYRVKLVNYALAKTVRS